MSDDVVRTITIKGVPDGIDETTSALNKLADAQANVSVVSDTASKATLSVQNALDRQQRSLDTTFRAQQQYNQTQGVLGQALNEGLIPLDRYNQLMALAAQRFDDVSKKASPFGVALSGVKTQMVALSAGLGPLGTGLAAFGPIGLAAGAGLAVIGEGLSAIKEQANEAGQWATTLQQAANIIGLTTTQVQALNEAAAQVGVPVNDNISAFEKFSVALGQLKDGSGTLYTELLKVNPALVNQLSLAKDSTTAWNLLAQAYASANAQQQALITRAAFGRGGAAEGQVLQATANAGGISGLTAANQSDAISQQQIQQWAQLTTQINSATEAAQHNFQSIFTTPVLTAEKNFADNMLEISRYAKEFSLSDDWKSFVAVLSGPTASTILSGLAHAAFPIASQVAGAVGSLFSPAAPKAAAASALPPAPNFDATFGAVSKSSSDVTTGSLGVQAAQAKAMVSALGSAATAQDKLDATTKQLNLDFANGKITQDTYNKALGGAQLDTLISQQNLYNSTLGEFATTQDLVNAKTLSLRKAQEQGAGLTSDQITAVKNLTAANDEWSRVTGQSQIGVFNLGLATKAAGDQFQVWIDKKYLDPNNPTQFAAAMQAMANKIQAASDAAQVAGSAFPQVAQLAVDAANVNKQFDTFASTSLNAISPSLTDMFNRTTTLSAGFQNLGLTAVKAFENMIIQMEIIKPLASSLGLGGSGGGLLSFLGLGGSNPIAPGGVVPGAIGPTSVGGAALVAAGGGMVTGPGSSTSDSISARLSNGEFVVNAAATRANLPLLHAVNSNNKFADGGLVGGNVVPMRGPTVQVNVNVDNSSGSDVSVSQQKNSSGGVDLNVMVRKAVDKNIASGYHDKTMKARFGASPVRQGR